MKIIYDARYLLTDHRFDGVSRYTHELAWALSRRDDVELTWIVYDTRQLAKLPESDFIMANDPKDIVREIFSLPKLLNQTPCDVVYSPFFMMGTLGKRYKLILTIHDMIYFAHRTPPYQYNWAIRAGWRAFHATYWPMRWILDQADAVATVSETARQELLSAHATKRPITTVLNAVSQIAPPKLTPRNTSNDIVYMGAFMPYKNVECLIDALAYLPDTTLHLLSKASPARKRELEQRAASLGVHDRIRYHDGATDAQYREILATARCLVTASKLEGFGLPIIEAQQQGVPVACSDTPIFREIGGDSVLYFDPDNPKDCAARIEELMDEKTSAKYIERGLQNAKRFSWDDSAEMAVELCKSIV